MNHSIYSADRMTHLKIVVVALVAGILVAGFSISTRTASDEGFTQTARVMKAGKPVVITSSGNYPRTVSKHKEFTNSRGSLQPPKVATWIFKTPTTPKLTEKAPAPHGRFLFVGCCLAETSMLYQSRPSCPGLSRASTSLLPPARKTWMAWHRRAEATSSFGRPGPAMTRKCVLASVKTQRAAGTVSISLPV